MTPSSLSIVVPIKDERDNLVQLFDEIERAVRPLGRPFEVIAVDDASTDGSRALLEHEAGRRAYLRVLFFRRHAGQTAAIEAGFRHAAGDVIVTLDADLQNDPADIGRLLRLIDVEGYDFVNGWRTERQDGLVLRRLPSRAGNWLIRRLTRTGVHDLGCAFRACRRELTRELRLHGDTQRFMGVLLEQVGARVGEVAVSHRARVAGVSKYRWPPVGRLLLDLLTVWSMHRYGSTAARVLGGVGVVWLGASALLAARVVFHRHARTVSVRQNPLSLPAVLLAAAGVHFVARAYAESGARVPYSIERTLGFEREPEGDVARRR